MPSGRRTSSRARGHRGFTLIEAAIATVILGSGVVAVAAAQRGFHLQNEWAAQAAVAQQLGVEVRELVLGLPQRDPVTGADLWGPEPDEAAVGDYDDLDDFDGAVFDAADGTGPLNALRAPIAAMDGWRQRVVVENIDRFDLTRTVDDGASDLMRVTVVVERRTAQDAAPREFTRVSWIAPRR
jgi:prepilin-type N-terminal cleavage/methylation domain-containing protein